MAVNRTRASDVWNLSRLGVPSSLTPRLGGCGGGRCSAVGAASDSRKPGLMQGEPKAELKADGSRRVRCRQRDSSAQLPCDAIERPALIYDVLGRYELDLVHH